MNEFFSNIISSIRITDVLDILIVAFVFYKVIGFIQESRVQQLVKGILVLVVVFALSEVLDLFMLNWILRGTISMGIIALVVIFQPELRRGLESLGRGKLVRGTFFKMDKEQAKEITDEFARAVDTFSRTRTGALIVIERNVPLTEMTRQGTVLNADISAQLLGNIFYEGAPLHDGAVIIRGTQVYAAGCVLPLTEDISISKDLGTRHRAGIGVTENSDALVIIVSEENGVISVAERGKLTRFLDKKAIEKMLLNLYIPAEEAGKSSKLPFGKREGGGAND